MTDREEISRGLAAGESFRAIAVRLGRHASTISRGVAVNGGRGCYRAQAADVRAWRQALRPKACKLAGSARLRRLVAGTLRQDWSPEQIAGWLTITFPDQDAVQVSHETFDASVSVQARGVLRKERQRHVRTRRVMRRARGGW